MRSPNQRFLLLFLLEGFLSSGQIQGEIDMLLRVSKTHFSEKEEAREIFRFRIHQYHPDAILKYQVNEPIEELFPQT